MPGNRPLSAPDSLGGPGKKRLSRLLQGGSGGPKPTELTMLEPRSSRRTVIRASRPALSDLRFKGDACVTRAAVCLGDYQLTQVALTPLDVPAMNRAFLQVRTGQARRNQARRLAAA
ncbi:MAG: hypothetical protein K2W96_03270 [Gemmataceae bacterium]|nr:hypothetical protein [Gemmataceae bacterium]